MSMQAIESEPLFMCICKTIDCIIESGRFRNKLLNILFFRFLNYTGIQLKWGIITYTTQLKVADAYEVEFKTHSVNKVLNFWFVNTSVLKFLILMD